LVAAGLGAAFAEAGADADADAEPDAPDGGGGAEKSGAGPGRATGRTAASEVSRPTRGSNDAVNTTVAAAPRMDRVLPQRARAAWAGACALDGIYGRFRGVIMAVDRWPSVTAVAPRSQP
jgi:hypothetical protein